jgi:hypothetical protein
MRERDESALARELLRHFLEAFVQDRSLFGDFQKIKYTVYKNDNHYEGEKAVAVGNRFLPPITMYCKCLHSKVNYYWSEENYY